MAASSSSPGIGGAAVASGAASPPSAALRLRALASAASRASFAGRGWDVAAWIRGRGEAEAEAEACF